MSAPSRRSAALLAQVELFLALPQQPKPLQVLYSTQPNWPFPSPSSPPPLQQIDIGVLDSSFNPPQLAHAALAKSKKPAFAKDDDLGKHQTGKDHYDALLLIFSVKNADKGTGTKKDASTVNRLEMMTEFARDIEEETSKNVAVAIVEEPLMITKSTLIHQFLEKQQNSSSAIVPARLHWLVGFDTLQRFFQVKYYSSPEYFYQGCNKYFLQEKTTFVCARRGIESLPNKVSDDFKEQQDEERELLESDLVKPWLRSIAMIDLDNSVQGISSTLIRRTISEEIQDKERLKAQLHQMTTKRIANFLVQEPVYGER